MWITLTRPNDDAIMINTDSIKHIAPISPLMGAGPLKVGTQISFIDASHQDVKEVFSVVASRLIN
jgi:hypothetical protein